jgi:hypothetical protein
MPFRAQYLNDIGLHANPYPHNAVERIQLIYQTARRGRINRTFALQIWAQQRQPYDVFVVHACLEIETLLVISHRGAFGIAQKILNLFMKDLWAFNLLPEAIIAHLHAPIDRRILDKFNDIPTSWNSWTQAEAGFIGAQTIIDYLNVQNHLRNLCTNTARFQCPIEMEQFI